MRYLILLAVLLSACSSSPTSPTPTPPVAVTPPVVSPPVTPPPSPSLPWNDPQFDITFYRAMAHDGFEHPPGLQPLTHWTRAPFVYMRTIDDQNAAVSAALLDQTAAAIINTTAQWTGGRFGVASLERGSGTREGQAGWITVKWSSAGVCGIVSGFGVEGLTITMNHRRSECTCGPTVARHELGHAMGFFHTNGPADLMTPTVTSCDKPMSEREKYHAAVAYSMPNGSLAP